MTRYLRTLVLGGLLFTAITAAAQPPGGGRGGNGQPPGGGRGGPGGPGPGGGRAGRGEEGRAMSSDEQIAILMAYDSNKDGKLTKEELTDTRLHRLFDRADTNKEGFVTKEKLLALFAKEEANPQTGGRGGPGGGRGGRGGPGGPGGGPGGPDGFPGGFPGGLGGGFGPPTPGTILPAFVRDSLQLTDAQQKQLDALQKEVDAKLDKILTDAQRKQLKEMEERGPGGFPGGPGGFPGGRNGVPGGGPPGGPGGRPGNEDPFPPQTPVTKSRTVSFTVAAAREAVEKALPVLWKGAEGHTDRRSCYTCHNHAVPLLAFVTARDRGFEVSEKDLAGQVDFLTEWVVSQRENLSSGRGPGPTPTGERRTGGATDTTGYVLFALETAGVKPDANTAAIAEYTLNWDRNLDHWRTPAPRPPTENSSFTTTALAIRGLQKYGRPESKEKVDQRVSSAREWLLRTKAKDTEDRVFRLMGLKAAIAKEEDVKAAAKDLGDTQRADGGWGQNADMGSDAYATGTALVALHQSGGMPVDDPAYRHGLEFLLGTQRHDGSWLVRTRSPPVQVYFETGFPHGKDQFISCAATGWATTALALACPLKK